MVRSNPDKILKCKLCKEVFRETDANLKSAGTTKEGDKYYNTECPECGTPDRMHEEYVGIPDETLDKLKEREISHNEAMEKRDPDLKEKEENSV